MKIAIVAVAYNRVDSLKRLLHSLETSYYPSDKSVSLIISVDKSKTDVVERFSDNYQWPHGKKIVDKHKKNLGLRQHMMSLGKWFNSYDSIIVLEDDIVVSPCFYGFAKLAVEKYHNEPSIAGISLYSIAMNYHNATPFVPLKDKYDAYFMNCAMSWGEVWMRESWNQFYDWYTTHQDFPVMKHLPYSICSWNEKSWLKYHTRYCIEENKFFVHPYTSLTTNYGDSGEHSDGLANTVYQVVTQRGVKDTFALPKFGSDAIYYDGFFENISLYSKLELNNDILCLDLYGEWNNRLKKRFWLTTQIRDFKIVKSYGLNYRPIELNVLLDNPGKQIFLYDTFVSEKNPVKKDRKVLLYHYHLFDMFFFVRRYGYINTIRDFIVDVKNKFGIK